MYKEAAFQSFFNGVTLIVVAAATIVTAGLLGPSGFGKYAALQSIAAMLMPLVTLRIETRIATCASMEQLGRLLSATATSVVSFVVVGVLVTPVLGLYFEWKLVLAVIVLAAGSAILETLISGYSYQGETRKVVKFRTVRQVLPSGIVLLCAFLFKDFQLAVAALVVSTLICVIILLLPIKHRLSLSIEGTRNIIREYASGLRASLALGSLNAVWLNGLLPLMNAMGLPYIAGQYAVAQRLMNAPLSVVAVAVQSVLLKGGNRLHEEGGSILTKVILLFFMAVLLAGMLYWAIYIQTFIPFPEAWKLDESLFCAASFFLACSFAVGTVSIIGVRLRDEWFLANWQLAFIVLWAALLMFFHSNTAFVYMLVVGGVGYWILLARWVILSRKKHG